MSAPSSALMPSADAGPKTDTQPVTEPGDSKSGVMAPMWGADLLWEDVYIIPDVIDMGFLLTRRVDEVMVWNTFTGESRALEAIDHVGAEGITIAPGDLPVVIEPYKDHTVTLITELTGPPDMRATLTYLFDNGAAIVQRLTGMRTLGFAFRPRAELKETLEWLTDVQEAHAGAEARVSVRIAPRQRFAGEYLQRRSDDMAALRAIVMGWQRRYFSLPLWHEGRVIGPVAAGSEWIGVDTAHASYKDGGFLMLHDGRDWRTAEIAQILEVFPQGLSLTQPTVRAFAGPTTVMPVRIARIEGDPSHEAHARHDSHAIVFAVEDNDPIEAPPVALQYKGHDLWLTPYKVSAQITQRAYAWPADIIDGATGKVLVDPRTTWGRVATHNARFSARHRAGAWALRQWLYRRAGRYRPLWVPTFAEDLRIVAPFSAGDTVLVIANNRYSDMLFANPQCRHIAIFRANGEVLPREILSCQVVDDDAEWITIDAAIGFAGTMADIRRISFLALDRLSTDRVEIIWKRIGVCDTSVGLVGLDMEG